MIISYSVRVGNVQNIPRSSCDITLWAEAQWGGPMRCHMAHGGKEGTHIGGREQQVCLLPGR